ncbi:ABC transporter ATP-binding protein [Pedobacter antarcticus]|uniref:ABC transporter ATP-binding protein n=1 Tax=Pedobacter antarcticus TaxID=34086 RepID=UPI0029318989|nr:ABC transporter ATP-binding protein [Pedobacter antarcticus]
MDIKLSAAGRRFNQEWIFRDISYTFAEGQKYAILGPNGSGKSTLLSLILGNLSPSEGEVSYAAAGNAIPEAEWYRQSSFAAPYLDLVEEFTLQETIAFHFKFKDLIPGLTLRAVLDLLGLSRSEDKALKYFSSGMKQRTKLALACCTDAPLLLLDEPTSNLDVQGVSWYQDLIAQFAAKKMVIIGSNQENEYKFCDYHLQISDYKQL